MIKNKSFDFSSFASANEGKNISEFDYLHAIYKTHDIDNDFFVCMANLFWPKFKLFNELIFIEELFVEAAYQQLLGEGNSAKSAQFWTNLLEITGLFDGISFAQAQDIANIIVATWNSKIIADFGAIGQSARMIVDDEAGEILLTIDCGD
jgi:hypothetical protein